MTVSVKFQENWKGCLLDHFLRIDTEWPYCTLVVHYCYVTGGVLISFLTSRSTGVSIATALFFYILLNTSAFGRFREFLGKNSRIARGCREFLRSGMCYRPGKWLKRHGKSSSLHSKNFFCLGSAEFLWVTSYVEDF